jgi:hypothetical protein
MWRCCPESLRKPGRRDDLNGKGKHCLDKINDETKDNLSLQAKGLITETEVWANRSRLGGGEANGDADALQRDADRVNRICRRVPPVLKRLSRGGGARGRLWRGSARWSAVATLTTACGVCWEMAFQGGNGGFFFFLAEFRDAYESNNYLGKI